MLADPSVAPLVDAYRTCEFVTLAKDGTPVAWPASGLPRAGGGFLLTTSIGFPQKAFNVRRDGRVALLFSDPTGSGLADPPHVLVRGTATCADVVHTEPEGELRDLWLRLYARQPGSRVYPSVPARWFTDFYFMRLLIEVTPASVEVVAAGTTGVSTVIGSTVVGSDVLSAYPSAVLASLDAGGAPQLHRTAVADHPGGGFAVDGGAAAPGPASLLVHRHDEKLSALHNALVRGTLERDGDAWVLTPSGVTQPAGRGPADVVATMRRCRATTDRYLAKRQLARPVVPWAEYRALAKAARQRSHSVPDIG
ncbi:pyridoxamine 5'-phosphate oxidase family protein [Actinoplanes sp. NPDC051494]|uniref:pyridoxamine 5'-phosphate oxidase family protein n=1 Tax=Actinoplanes sp. NPDC051494 TaxID=3363907 RepID=UPI0037980DC0